MDHWNFSILNTLSQGCSKSMAWSLLSQRWGSDVWTRSVLLLPRKRSLQIWNVRIKASNMWKDVLGETGRICTHFHISIYVCVYLFSVPTFSFTGFLDMPKMVYRLKWLVALPVNSYERIEITVFEQLHIEKICCWD